MFFGKRRKPKPADRAPKEFGGDDFGFDEGDEPRRPRQPVEDAPRRAEKSRAADPDDFDSDFSDSRSAGRTVDDPTIVPARAPVRDSPLLTPSSHGGDDMDRPDATVVIGRPVDPRTSVVAWLVVATGAGRGRDYRVGERPTRIGTAAECEIRLAGDAYVSTNHAEVVLEGGQVVVRDVGSRNGTYCNDERVQETELRDGDRLRVGLSEFVFKSVRL